MIFKVHSFFNKFMLKTCGYSVGASVIGLHPTCTPKLVFFFFYENLTKNSSFIKE